MTDWQQLQSERNFHSRSAWDAFAAHRMQVTGLLLAAAGYVAQQDAAASLVIFGAGNCNDLDLAVLARNFARIHLVDLDRTALDHGLQQQQCDQLPQIELHAGCDLTGIFSELSAGSAASPLTEEPSQKLLEAARSAAPNLPDPCDVAASVCLLSQLLDVVGQALTTQHPRFLEFITAVRLRHLELLLAAVKPGGTALLITDIVSSDTLPALKSAKLPDLPPLLAQALQARNFFTGLHPGVVHQLLQSETSLTSQIASVKVLQPWLWDLGPRVYAVTAFAIRRQA